MRKFISQGYTVFFIEQIANTVILESAMGYFAAHQSFGWHRKYPQTKTRKKLSEKLLCDFWIHLTELHCSFHWAVCEHCFRGKCNTLFGSALRSMVKKDVSSDKEWKEAFWETALWCVKTSPSVTVFFSLSSLLTLFSWNLQWDISSCSEACGDEISSDKNWIEAFWESSLCCVNSWHRVTMFFSLSSQLTLFSWNL